MSETDANDGGPRAAHKPAPTQELNMRKTITKKAKRTSIPMEVRARTIATLLQGIAEMDPVKQMRVYFRVGRELVDMYSEFGRFGRDALTEAVALVPELGGRQHAEVMRAMAWAGAGNRKRFLQQAGIPMSNGQPLTIDHWAWVLFNCPTHVPEDERDDWRERELDWLRRAALSADVMAHFGEMTDELQGEISDLEMERDELQGELGDLESERDELQYRLDEPDNFGGR